jgi:hypothetical protein
MERTNRRLERWLEAGVCAAVLAFAAPLGAAPTPSASEARAVFAARRADTVQVLDQCSAEQLNRIGIEPSRGPMIVADLVAVMLAHDTDSLGDLVARL